MLPSDGGISPAPRDHLPRPRAAAVALHWLSRRPDSIIPMVTGLVGVCAVGALDRIAIRSRDLDRFSTDADAGHDGDVTQTPKGSKRDFETGTISGIGNTYNRFHTVL